MHQARRGGHGIKKVVVKVKQRNDGRTNKYGDTTIERSSVIIRTAVVVFARVEVWILKWRKTR